MKNIFAFLVHQDSNALDFTLTKLSHNKNNIIIIHVDKKADISDFSKYCRFSNVRLIEDRVECKWGHISLVDATLNLLTKALEYDFKYFSLLSGDDVLVGTEEELSDFLDKESHNIMAFLPKSKCHIHIEQRVKFRFRDYKYDKNKKNRHIPLRIIDKLSKFLNLRSNKYFYLLPTLYKGTQWFTINKEAVLYIFKFLENNKFYHNAFLETFCPDEIFFHTILGNSMLNFSEYSRDTDHTVRALRYIDWKSGPEYPRTIIVQDFNKVLNSGCFFARKIEPSITLEQLEIL